MNPKFLQNEIALGLRSQTLNQLKHGIIPSVSRRGQFWDNAVAESSFGSLKSELDLPRRQQTSDQVMGKLFDYIEVFYNRQRLHSFNGYRSPVQTEAEAVC